MSITQGMQVVGFLIIIGGLLSIFARDFFWRWEKFGDAVRGKHSERTAVWDMWQVLKGILALIIGLALLTQGHL